MADDLPSIGHTVSTLGIVEAALGLRVTDGVGHVVWGTRTLLVHYQNALNAKLGNDNAVEPDSSTGDQETATQIARLPQAELEAKIAELKEADKRTVKVYNELGAEIEMIQRQKTSVLELLHVEQTIESAVFTKRSAYEWLNNFGISVDQWAPPEPNSGQKAPGAKLREDARTNYALIIAGMMRHCARLATEDDRAKKTRYGSVNEPNATAIREGICKELKEAKAKAMPKERTINNKLSEATKTLASVANVAPKA